MPRFVFIVGLCFSTAGVACFSSSLAQAGPRCDAAVQKLYTRVTALSTSSPNTDIKVKAANARADLEAARAAQAKHEDAACLKAVKAGWREILGRQ